MYSAASEYLYRFINPRKWLPGWSGSMKNIPKGEFSANLFSLQLQIKHMLEGVGGDAAVELLDGLAKLSSSEQQVMLKVFTRVIEKITEGDKRLVSEIDKELDAFEECLYQDIVSGMEDASNAHAGLGGKLQVVSGGLCPSTKKTSANEPIDFEKARRLRKSGFKSLFN